MKTRWTRWALVVGFAALAALAYFTHVEWQTRLGQEAIDATQLEFLPLDVALLRAQEQGKPVLVDFSAIWCPTCRQMHAKVFTDRAVKAAIGRGYILSRVDYESPEAPAFMQRYGVSGFPTLLVVDAAGNLLRGVPVSLDPAMFAESLTVAIR